MTICVTGKRRPQWGHLDGNASPSEGSSPGATSTIGIFQSQHSHHSGFTRVWRSKAATLPLILLMGGVPSPGIAWGNPSPPT